MTISMDKKYKTKNNGFAARIICVDRVSKTGHSVVALVLTENGILDDEMVVNYTAEGKANTDGALSSLDLIEVSPWDDFQIDDQVIAGIFGCAEFNAHFAGVVDGRPSVFEHAATSWTSKGEVVVVDRVRKRQID